KEEEVWSLSGGLSGKLTAFLGQLDRVLLLVEREVELVVDDVHVLGVVLEVLRFGAQDELRNAGLAFELEELFVARKAAFGAQQREAGFGFEIGRRFAVGRGQLVSLLELLLGFSDELGDQALLGVDELLDRRLQLFETVVRRLRNRA